MSYLSTEEIIYNLPNYAVVGLIRSGRVADTYHVKKENQNGCIRILKPELIADTDSVLQFKNEYRALKSIQHDSFLTMLEWGEFQGVSYTVSEYFPHTTLRDYVLSHTLSIHEKDEIIQQLITAVHVMHHQGMIHFGIKPSNVLYHDGKIKLIQLGQVRFSNQTLEYPAPLITAEYAEPELIAGEIEVSTSADIYAILSLMKFLHVGNEEHLNQDLEDPQQQAFFLNYFHAPYAQRPKTCEELLACLQGGTVATAQEIQPQQEVKEVSPINTSSGWLKKSILITAVVALTCLGFYYFNKGSALLEEAAEDKIKRPVAPEMLELQSFPTTDQLNPAQKKFWTYLEQFNRLPDKPTADALAIYNSKGIAPQFKYLETSEKSVLGDIEGLTAHRELFVKRYAWVEALMKKYSVQIPMSAIRFNGTAKEIGKKYENFMFETYDAKEMNKPELTTKEIVANWLEALLVIDYVYARGSLEDRETADDIWRGVFFGNMFLNSYNTGLDKELRIPSAIEIGWATIADYPQKMWGITTALAGKPFREVSKVDHANYCKWLLRIKGVPEKSNDYRQGEWGTLHNYQVRAGLWRYSIYSAHCRRGRVRPAKGSTDIAIKILFRKVFPKTHKVEYPKYLKLLNAAYPAKR